MCPMGPPLAQARARHRRLLALVSPRRRRCERGVSHFAPPNRVFSSGARGGSVATRRKDSDRHDLRDADREWAAVARTEVVEILAGAVLELFLRGATRPSSDGRSRPERSLNSPTT